MMQSIIFIAVIAMMIVAVCRSLVIGWRSDGRSRRLGPSNNWQNEGYMANQDGMSLSEIDSTIGNSAPPQRGSGGRS